MRETRLTQPGVGAPQPGAGQPESGAGQLAAPAASRTTTAAFAAFTSALTRLWHGHRLFIIAAAVSVVPRVLASLAFRPALLTADSFLYMQEATKARLGDIRPSGYSLLLWLVKPLPAPLLVVTTLQHLMAIAIAALAYGLLRYWGLPAWGACLAALPTLFDTREIALESYILPDTLFTLAVMIVVALLITKSVPRRWQCALAGLLLAYVAVLRGNGLPLAVVAVLFLLIRRVGWRALAAGAAAFAVPLFAYVGVYHAEYGQFNITTSDGMFLWSRTTSFANCAGIKPSARLAPLCPDRETSVAPPGPAPPWSIHALLAAPTPADYLWAGDAWWRHDAHPGFNPYNNKLGLDFALAAIKAQPLSYLRVSARDVMLVFLATDRPVSHETMSFTAHPHIRVLPSYYVTDISEYAGITSNTHLVQPYAYYLFLYQLPVYFPGVAFLAVVVAGLVGVIRNRRRRGGPQALPWALAVVSIVVPALVTQSLYRYTMVAIPLACVAAGLAFARVDGFGREAVPAVSPSPASPAPGSLPGPGGRTRTRPPGRSPAPRSARTATSSPPSRPARPAARRKSPTDTGLARPSRRSGASRRAASSGRFPPGRSAAARRGMCRAGTRNAGSRAGIRRTA